MRIVFAGTPQFSETILGALLEAGHTVTAVLCQPDRPAGRGQKLVVGPVKARALAQGLPVYQPESLRSPEVQEQLAAIPADVWVVVAYGALIPPPLLHAAPLGCINIHASLLPRWRGAAPIQRAILAGDTKTGVAIMQMEAGLDTGPVLLSEALPITEEDTTGSLHDALAALGARLILSALQDLPRRLKEAKKQSDQGVTYAHKIQKEEARLNWTDSAQALSQRIRAFTPAPGAWFQFAGERIRVGEARWVLDAGPVEPGRVISLEPRLRVGTGQGALEFISLQRAGGRMLPIKEFLRGMDIQEGACFE